MSDNIPFDIQTEIFQRVPDVKSLLRLRLVSKQWKSVIEASEFIASYRPRKTQPHTLYLSYTDNSDKVRCFSFNNDTRTQQQDLSPNVSDFMKQLRNLRVIGYSRGLFLLCTSDKGGMLVLWNPSLRRSVGILGFEQLFSNFSFAVCPVTNEPTIVKVSYSWKVQTFTLSSRRWTEIQCIEPSKSVTPFPSQVVISSCIYWVACEMICHPNGHTRYMIMSFDLIAKEFTATDLPDKITLDSPWLPSFRLSKLKGSLVVIVPDTEVKVWKMETDCSFTQLFTIKTPYSPCSYYLGNVVGFRKNSELLFETQERLGQSALENYDPYSKHINNLGFSGHSCSFFISSYEETLLLLDHSDSCVYPEIDHKDETQIAR